MDSALDDLLFRFELALSTIEMTSQERDQTRVRLLGIAIRLQKPKQGTDKDRNGS